MKDYIKAQPRGGFVMVIKSQKRFALCLVRSVF